MNTAIILGVNDHNSFLNLICLSNRNIFFPKLHRHKTKHLLYIIFSLSLHHLFEHATLQGNVKHPNTLVFVTKNWASKFKCLPFVPLGTYPTGSTPTPTHTHARARLKEKTGGEEHLLYETFSFHLALKHQIFNYVGSNMD